MPMMSIAIYENIRKDGEQLQQLITRMLPEAEVEFWETETGFIVCSRLSGEAGGHR